MSDLARRKVYEHEDGSVSIGYEPVSPTDPIAHGNCWREALEQIRDLYGQPIAPDLKLARIYRIAAAALRTKEAS